MVAEAERTQAHEMFMQLERAYRTSDLGAVNRILESLKVGFGFVERVAELDEAVALEREAESLRRRCQQLSDELRDIHESETWRTLAGVEDWDSYFEERKRKLDVEIERIRGETIV
jgi:hypothetical protein